MPMPMQGGVAQPLAAVGQQQALAHEPRLRRAHDGAPRQAGGLSSPRVGSRQSKGSGSATTLHIHTLVTLL